MSAVAAAVVAAAVAVATPVHVPAPVHAPEVEVEIPQVDLEYDVAGADAFEPAASDKEKAMFYVFKVGA